MKISLIVIALSLFSISVFAQRDPLDDLERLSRRETQNRTYARGEETWAMVTKKARTETANAPTLRTRAVVLSNNDVLRMKAAGFADETIIAAINTRESLFDTTPEMLIAMKKAGISEPVLNAMMGADTGTRGNLIPLDKNGMPAEIGIYIQGKERMTEMDAEPISWQTGGVWKSRFLPTRGHINGKVMSPRSRYQVDPNAEFVIRTPEGVAPSEYLLVELYEKDNRREFRILTGGVIHRSSGAERTSIPYTYRKIAPRTYYVVLNNLRRGEYGFLPTNLMNSTSAAFVGKLYSFSVD